MNLMDVLPLPKEVHTGRGVIEVNGITLEQMSSLLMNYREVILPYFSKNSPDIALFVQEAPDIAAKVICMATNSEGQEDIARKFSFAIQLEIVMAAWDLSVPDLKKFLQSLSEVTGKLGELPPAPAPSPETVTES